MDLRPDVVAGKYDPSLFDESGETLLVNEVFYSLQGEGTHSGIATVFIRLAKCNLACKFCDTEFETYTRRAVEDIVAEVLSLSPPRADGRPRVDVTGGEPALQNAEPLVSALQKCGFVVGVETSGSVWHEWLRAADWVTVSPKVPLARIPIGFAQVASEFKWVVNQTFLAMYERDQMSVYRPILPNFVQPESNNPKWMFAATKLILRHPDRYRLSLQTHKIVGNR